MQRFCKPSRNRRGCPTVPYYGAFCPTNRLLQSWSIRQRNIPHRGCCNYSAAIRTIFKVGQPPQKSLFATGFQLPENVKLQYANFFLLLLRPWDISNIVLWEGCTSMLFGSSPAYRCHGGFENNPFQLSWVSCWHWPKIHSRPIIWWCVLCVKIAGFEKPDSVFVCFRTYVCDVSEANYFSNRILVNTVVSINMTD